MTRRRRGGESSLELLLDTICNTFGGILFVALLIIVMLQMTSKTDAANDSKQVSEEDAERLEQQQVEIASTLETLRAAAAELEQQLSNVDAPIEQLEELKDSREVRQALVESRLAALGRIAERQASINRNAKELEELDEKAKTADQRRKSLETDLKAEVEKRSQRADFSAARTTHKTEIQTVLRYGRFYVWHKHGPRGERLGLNTEEFVVLDGSGDTVHTTPMPHAGTIVSDDQDSAGALAARLKEFSSSRHYIAVVVWPDSFAQFRYLKRALVQNGFEYRLIPAEQDSKFYDRGGSSDGVQ